MVCKMLGDFEFRLAPPQRIVYCSGVSRAEHGESGEGASLSARCSHS